MRVPVKIVIDGVVNPLLIFSAKTQVERGNAKMIEKSGEVGARTERTNAQVRSLPYFLAILRRFRFGNRIELCALPNRHLISSRSGFRILNTPPYSINKLLQTMRPVHIQNAAVISIRIDVDSRMLAQLVGMRFHPLRRAQ